MARLRQLVVDCHRPAPLARFWAEALAGYEVRAYDDAEVARLAALGLTPETDPVVILDGPGPEICFQQVEVHPSPKKPLHLDLETADRSSEEARLVALGATVVAPFDAHTWMRDPEGNDFCLADPRTG
ncbi:MAG TPA: VOC family protein [Aquihabitans sp.]|nr:VOC family protein [Aquihabitans sp.]